MSKYFDFRCTKVCQKYHWLSFLLQISLILPNNDLHAFFQIIRQKLTLDKACHTNKHFLLKWLSKWNLQLNNTDNSVNIGIFNNTFKSLSNTCLQF